MMVSCLYPVLSLEIPLFAPIDGSGSVSSENPDFPKVGFPPIKDILESKGKPIEYIDDSSDILSRRESTLSSVKIEEKLDWNARSMQ